MIYCFIILLFQSDPSLAELNKQVKFYESKAKYDSALVIAQAGYEKARIAQNYKFKAIFSLRIASILCKVDRCSEGLQYFKRSLLFSDKTNDDGVKGKAYLGIGASYQYLDKNDSALYYYSKASPILERVGDMYNVAGIKNNVALIHAEIDSLSKSHMGLEQALQIQKDIGALNGLVTAHNNLGRFFLSIKEYSRALDSYEKAISLHTKIQDNLLKSDSYFGKALCLKALNNFPASISNFLKYDSLISPFYHQNYSDKILELETKFRTAEIERDNALKQAQIESQEQRMIFLYSVAGFLTLAILGVYIYNEQRKKIMRSLALQKEQENNKRIEDLLKQQELQSAYAMLAGQEKAHKRIAEELHDNLGSILVTLNMFADTLQKKTDPAAQKELARKISEVAQIANEATRTISHSLDSGVLKHFGLASAVQELTNALNESQTITVISHIQVEDKLDSEISLNVYRVLQELINNTLKHARATRLNIELTRIGDQLSLIYEDNGIGFNLAEAMEKKGLGLQSLRSRVERMNGELTIDTTPEKGTTIIVEIALT